MSVFVYFTQKGIISSKHALYSTPPQCNPYEALLFLRTHFPMKQKTPLQYLKRGFSSERGIRTLDTTGMNRML